MELGDTSASRIKFQKTGSTTAGHGDYHDWEANAPHDPNHQGVSQDAAVPVSEPNRALSSLRRRIRVSVCYLSCLFAIIALLITLLALYLGFMFGRAHINVNPTIVINGVPVQQTVPGSED
jgi:hypothetical protein